MFPVTLFYQVYSINDFSPFGYVTNLAASIGKAGSHVLEPGSVSGTDGATNVTSGGLSVSVELPSQFNPFKYLMVCQSATPTNFKTFNLFFYNPFSGPDVTGTLEVEVGAITGNWTLSAVQLDRCPALVCQGGIGEVALAGEAKLFSVELGLNYPAYSMQRIFEDFDTFSQEVPDPWYVYKRSPVSGTSSVTSVALFPGDLTESKEYLGLLKLATKGIQNAAPIDDEVISLSSESVAFVSYGRFGFINPLKGGPVDFRARLRPSHDLEPSNVCKIQVGLRGSSGAIDGTFLNSYGIGFEASSIENSQRLVIICAYPGNVKKIVTPYSLSSTAFTDVSIKINPFYKTASFFVNKILTHTEDLSQWDSLKQTLLHPAFSHATATTNERAAYFDLVYVTQKIDRGTLNA